MSKQHKDYIILEYNNFIKNVENVQLKKLYINNKIRYLINFNDINKLEICEYLNKI